LRRIVLIYHSFDLDLPAECDDEFWKPSVTGNAFEQPGHLPSSVSFFIWDLKLQYIVSFAIRTVVSPNASPVLRLVRCLYRPEYSINKSKIALGFVEVKWEQRIITKLDTALSQWLESVPSHRSSLFYLSVLDLLSVQYDGTPSVRTISSFINPPSSDAHTTLSR
jgi:hypothetical protein